MPATAAAPSAAPPQPPRRRRRVYATVHPRCEWASTEHDDRLVVDVSGFRKEELRVLYSTNRKLKVTGERQVDGGHWARFVKVFPVPKSCDAGAIRASMNIINAQLSVVLPKSSSSSSSKDKQEENPSKDKQNEHQSMVEHKGEESAGGSSGSSSGAQEGASETDKFKEKEQREHQAMEEQRQEAVAGHDSPKVGDDSANAVERDDEDDKGESRRRWRNITVIHVLGFVLILALVGVGATLLYVTSL